MKHYSVMCEEIITGLNIKKGGIYVDATLGYGGMSKKILEQLDNTGMLIAFDQDEEAINYSDELLSNVADNYQIIKTNFCNLKEKLNEIGITKIDGIIFDLGFSSPQIDDASRGFSFMNDGLLDMRMDKSAKLTAKEVINKYKMDDLVNCFFLYGEEKMARVIAQKIVEKRSEKAITRTLELVDVIKEAVGANYFYKQHPERKIFQALRILVNDELGVLKKALVPAIEMLNKEGRICVITFHSLEDRIVKNIFKENAEVNDIFKGLPTIPVEYQPKLKLITKKPLIAKEEEIKENSRSHSAKLRIAERI